MNSTTLNPAVDPDIQGWIEKRPNLAVNILGFGLCATFLAMIAWSCIGELDIVVVAQGETVAPVKSQTVQSVRSGQLKAVLVNNGDFVEKGQPIVQLDPNKTDTELKELDRRASLTQREAILHRALAAEVAAAELFGGGSLIALTDSERADLIARLEDEQERFGQASAQLDQDLERLDAALGGNAQEVATLNQRAVVMRDRRDKLEKLVERGFVARRTFDDLELALDEMAGQVQLLETRAEELRAQRESARIARKRLASSTKAQWEEQLRLSEQEMDELASRRALLQQELEVMTVLAPVDGIVQERIDDASGAFIQPGQPLMVINPPTERLYVQAAIGNGDLGFLKPGMPARVKLEAFPFTRHGVLTGRLTKLAQSNFRLRENDGEFPAEIDLVTQSLSVDGLEVSLTPGMRATVEITTGKRKVIDLLLSPLQRYRDEVGTQR